MTYKLSPSPLTIRYNPSTSGGRTPQRSEPKKHPHAHRSQFNFQLATSTDWVRDTCTLLQGPPGPKLQNLQHLQGPLQTFSELCPCVVWRALGLVRFLGSHARCSFSRLSASAILESPSLVEGELDWIEHVETV